MDWVGLAMLVAISGSYFHNQRSLRKNNLSLLKVVMNAEALKEKVVENVEKDRIVGPKEVDVTPEEFQY